jgi:hypothetical protein
MKQRVGPSVRAAFGDLLAGRAGFFVVAEDGSIVPQSAFESRPRLIFPGTPHATTAFLFSSLPQQG